MENEHPQPGQNDVYFYYLYQHGQPVVNTTGNGNRSLARETIEPDRSILVQRRDPETYPELAWLAQNYENVRIYREWSFGRNTIFREPQQSDMRRQVLEEDFSNLGLFLNRLKTEFPAAKRAILKALQDLYEGISDFEVNTSGGTVQVFLHEGDFAIPATRLSDGTLRYLCLLAILSYTMKQAIQEGFILDVLKHYTPVESYYRLAKTVEGDPEFEVKKARKKLRRYVESHHKAIGDKAEIMVDHFLEQVVGQHKIGGQARVIVVTGSIQRAIQYFFAFRTYLEAIKSPYKPIVAFSGEPEYEGQKVSEAKLNGFPSREIEDRIQQDPYRFLICAEKFQTGYDEPLLHTMYVDKVLSGIKAVQTLSRLNRAHPKKRDVFVLDFQNNTETIERAFADYYRTTILSAETDPNKLHTLKAELDAYQVYTPEQVESLVSLYLDGADRNQLDPILDACVAVYVADLDEDGQVDFKGKAKAFARTYEFLATILPYGVPDWEKLSLFLNFLIPKLPAPVEEDLAKGILETIDPGQSQGTDILMW